MKSEYYLKNFEDALKYCSNLLEVSETAYVYGFKATILPELKKYGPAMDSFFKALRLDKSRP